ncbi:PEP/pyruvate-binding domain-containing protein [Aestuariicoccus sp. MJ-SS9]|uniref:PEP/pyruvate-binding domain-containing protein n=1 Tax=Aestuariicoccus sp. MJ-SS9 TaxID=3079855 RepID=UPI002913BCCD|nr:PEP/pyruvate-binding domain-containing protein [Aestuariicoccus sp. MJ-SS9]MDU8913820.1 PEP/pyruvate-binding domain-containing protein [Aestuariicoccus sp. MJ-SS9]
MNPVPLASACEEQTYGGKATQLGAALRAGLPVPEGVALDAAFVEALATGVSGARDGLERICDALPGEIAVRSSAIGEDSAEASFAGQHATVLNASGPAAVLDAVRTVWQSGHSDSAKAYRARLGTKAPIRMGIVLQKLVAADVAGVLFTCNPVTGQDEIVIEAAWGLGEVVVQGMVIPDSYRLHREGQVLESRVGYKDVRIERQPTGGTATESVAAHLVEAACLDAARLTALHGLSERCHAAFGTGPHDIEWAFEADRLYLLQRRPVTTIASS